MFVAMPRMRFGASIPPVKKSCSHGIVGRFCRDCVGIRWRSFGDSVAIPGWLRGDLVEAIHEDNRCRCLFATHYHELTRLAERCDALSLHHVRAREWKGDLVLLHEVAEGPADRSYGLAVARLAGLPGSTPKTSIAVSSGKLKCRTTRR